MRHDKFILGCLGVGVVVALVGGALLFAYVLNGTGNTVTGCERTNDGVRQPFYDFISAAIVARDAEGDVATADNYRTIRRKIVDAAAEHPKFPGSPQVDCEAAF